MTARTFVSTLAAASLAAGILGCDKEKTREAADKAGEGVKKAVVVVGDASHDAAATVGGAVEKAGGKLKEAAHDDATTRPTTPPVP